MNVNKPCGGSEGSICSNHFRNRMVQRFNPSNFILGFRNASHQELQVASRSVKNIPVEMS